MKCYFYHFYYGHQSFGIDSKLLIVFLMLWNGHEKYYSESWYKQVANIMLIFASTCASQHEGKILLAD